MPKKENEMEIPEELVEEIAGILNQWRKCGRLERTPDIPEGIWRKDCPDIFEITEEESAELLITRVGKAYADGMPLPGEVGRDRVYYINDDGTSRGIVTLDYLEEKVGPDDILIHPR